MTTAISARSAAQQDLYELYHESWNTLTAIHSYLAFLEHSSVIQGVEHEAIVSLQDLARRLEASLEGIRARMLSMVGGPAIR